MVGSYVLATCGIRRLGEAFESTPFHRSFLADSSEEEYNGKHSLAYLHQGRTSIMHRILTFATSYEAVRRVLRAAR